MKKLPESEQEIMMIIWEYEEPVSRFQVEEKLNVEKNVAPSTILTLLTRLEKKGFIQKVRNGKSNLYVPLVEKENHIGTVGKNMLDIENSRWAILIIILMYLWKNISFSIVLFWSGINWIPQIYHEQCQLDGATGRQEFQYITWILLKPTTLVVLLMSIVNSFKVFKEIYMLYGAYPSPYVYMLQHYMNNQFLSLNMQKLSAAAWCMFLILGIFLGIIYRVQRKNLDYL